MERVLTGLQPSGNITIGNYLGSIKQMVGYQTRYDSFIFIADLHAITVPQDPESLHKNTRELVALYIACGVDPSKNTIYIQSENIYHAGLSWILECLTPYGELGRMHQFKEKSKRSGSFSAGLLTYPILMAADIILYDADFVPVGIDQKQHVELARDIVYRFNSRFGDTFKLPDALIPDDVAKVMDLQNPAKKMSKSADNPNGIIYMLDDEKSIVKKIKSAVTDSAGTIEFDPENRPGISNLISLYSGLANIGTGEVVRRFANVQYGAFKAELADLAIGIIRPMQSRFRELIDSAELDACLDEGKERTAEIARAKYELVKQKVGLYR
jgi:tryptophanyl-tRNA synthetase